MDPETRLGALERIVERQSDNIAKLDDLVTLLIEQAVKTEQRFQETARRFEETDKKFQETDRKFRETDEKFRETDRKFKETDARIEKLVSAIGAFIGKSDTLRQ